MERVIDFYPLPSSGIAHRCDFNTVTNWIISRQNYSAQIFTRGAKCTIKMRDSYKYHLDNFRFDGILTLRGFKKCVRNLRRISERTLSFLWLQSSAHWFSIRNAESFELSKSPNEVDVDKDDG